MYFKAFSGFCTVTFVWYVKQIYTIIKAKQLQTSPELEWVLCELLYLNESTACRNFFIGGPLLLLKLAISTEEINQSWWNKPYIWDKEFKNVIN